MGLRAINSLTNKATVRQKFSIFKNPSNLNQNDIRSLENAIINKDVQDKYKDIYYQINKLKKETEQLSAQIVKLNNSLEENVKPLTNEYEILTNSKKSGEAATGGGTTGGTGSLSSRNLLATSDDEASDDEASDDEASDDEASDDEANNLKQQIDQLSSYYTIQISAINDSLSEKNKKLNDLYIINRNGIPDTQIEINKLPKNYKDETTDTHKQFSFRTNSDTRLHICPPLDYTANLNFEAFDKDISNKSLYNYNIKNKKSTVTFLDTILNNIPAIQIREYQPDYKPEQIVAFFVKFIEGFQQAVADNDEDSQTVKTPESIRQKAHIAIDKAKDLFKTIGSNLKSGVSTLMEQLNTLLINNTPSIKNQINGGEDDDLYMFTIPYIFYYRLMGYVTTNFYTIPFSGSQEIISSNGQTGWESSMFQITGAENASGIVGNLFKSIIGNLKINRNPRWDPDKYDEGPSYSIKFSLYNYCQEAAINNFIFINTIIPNNMSIQYGFIHHPSSLYDIKIEGGARLFCCSANFKCQYKGVLRNVPDKFINVLQGKYGNQINLGKEKINEAKLIKIPDVYEVTVEFKSLLPNTFNEYLYRFAQPDIKGFTNDKIKNDINTYTQDIYDDVIDAVNTFIKDLVTKQSTEDQYD